MKLAKKKSKELAEALEHFQWFREEMKQYVKDGDLTWEQANRLIEDKADILGL